MFSLQTAFGTICTINGLYKCPSTVPGKYEASFSNLSRWLSLR